MMKNVLTKAAILLCAVMLCTACSRTHKATDFSGLSTPDGKLIAHLNTSHLALHVLGSQPVVGDATLQATVADFTRAAKEENAASIRIVQSRVFSWWFIFPPFSFVLTPVSSNVAGDALR